MSDFTETPSTHTISQRVTTMAADWKYLMLKEHGYSHYCAWTAVDYEAEYELTCTQYAELEAAGVLPDTTSNAGRELAILGAYRGWLRYAMTPQQ